MAESQAKMRWVLNQHGWEANVPMQRGSSSPTGQVSEIWPHVQGNMLAMHAVLDPDVGVDGLTSGIFACLCRSML